MNSLKLINASDFRHECECGEKWLTKEKKDACSECSDAYAVPEEPSQYAYHEVVGTFEGQDEVLYGSYNKADCLYEKESESFLWKDSGYRKIRLSQRLVQTPPDPEVYG